MVGWREEIAPYRIGIGSFNVPNLIEYGSGRAIEKVSPLIPIRLAELIWQDEALAEAAKARHVWSKVIEEIPDMHPGHPRWGEMPSDAFYLLNEFQSWYLLKVPEPCFYGNWLSCAEGILFGVMDGEFASTSSPDVLRYVTSNQWAKYFGLRPVG